MAEEECKGHRENFVQFMRPFFGTQLLHKLRSTCTRTMYMLNGAICLATKGKFNSDQQQS
jgi:hypothetical protein